MRLYIYPVRVIQGDSSDEAIYSLYSATKKLHAFSAVYTIHTTPIIDIWESVIRTLKQASQVPDEVRFV